MIWLPEYANIWLIACECSGRIRDAMIARGISAISCDLKPTRSPGPHLQCDVREILHWPWSGMIAHPVCRYLTQAGVRWLYIGGNRDNGLDFERWRLMREGAEFYRIFCDATHIPLRAVENPIMHGYAVEIIGHRATQFVQPWWFGSPKTKATGFKLYGLPKLPREWPKSWYAHTHTPRLFTKCIIWCLLMTAKKSGALQTRRWPAR